MTGLELQSTCCIATWPGGVVVRRLVDKQLKVKNGDLVLHQTPGLGFNFDEKAVRTYALNRVKPWSVVK